MFAALPAKLHEALLREYLWNKTALRWPHLASTFTECSRPSRPIIGRERSSARWLFDTDDVCVSDDALASREVWVAIRSIRDSGTTVVLAPTRQPATQTHNQSVGDLALAEVSEVREFDHFAVSRRQRRQCPAHGPQGQQRRDLMRLVAAAGRRQRHHQRAKRRVVRECQSPQPGRRFLRQLLGGAALAEESLKPS